MAMATYATPATRAFVGADSVPSLLFSNLDDGEGTVDDKVTKKTKFQALLVEFCF